MNELTPLQLWHRVIDRLTWDASLYAATIPDVQRDEYARRIQAAEATVAEVAAEIEAASEA